jgi:Sulfotransferase family
MGSTGAPLTVLSVVGAGRSGTTVLASLLNEVEGITSAGELRWLWERGVRAGRPCGCGEPPEQCPVWAPVIAASRQQLSGRTPPRTVDDLVAAQHALKRTSAFPGVLNTVDRTHPQGGPTLRFVQEVIAAACRTLATTTKASVVVDTSKRPLDAAVLAGVPDLDTYVLHVVRDPRAVVHSWSRAKTYSAAGGLRVMGTRGLASSVRRWTGNALYAEALRRRYRPDRWLHIRYEDFAARPRDTIQEILDFLDVSAATPFMDARVARLHPNHIVAGNPSRFTTGEVTIRTDDAWMREMPRGDQRVVAALTLPLRMRYGYVGRSD